MQDVASTCSIHLLNPSAQSISSTHLLNPSAQSTCSIHLLNPSVQPICSIHLFNPPAQSICSIHLLNPSAQSTCSIHLLNPSALPPSTSLANCCRLEFWHRIFLFSNLCCFRHFFRKIHFHANYMYSLSYNGLPL
jgi:hypothetical protein